MSTRLFVRLKRDANVPGERCEWILRDSRGAQLRRGEDGLTALPKADEIIGILTQDLVLIRSVELPPGRRARTPVALANAMEPFLLSDPMANHVVVLGEARNGTTVLAAIARAWLDPLLAALAQANRPLSRLIVESSLVNRARDTWIAVCRTDGGFLCTDDEQAIALDTARDGGVPEGIRSHAQSTLGSTGPGSGSAQTGRMVPTVPAIPTIRTIRTIRVYHDAGLRVDVEAWRSALGLAVEDAGPWDWAWATGPESDFKLDAAADILSAITRERAAAEPRMRNWRVPLVLAVLVLVVHVGATGAQWLMRSSERAALRADMNAVFRKSVSPSEPLVDAVLQTRRALGSAQRIAGQYAPEDFMNLLGRVAAETSAMPANALRSLSYSSGTLTAEWRGVPAATLERLAEQLRARGLQVELSSAAAQARLTVRAEP